MVTPMIVEGTMTIRDESGWLHQPYTWDSVGYRQAVNTSQADDGIRI